MSGRDGSEALARAGQVSASIASVDVPVGAALRTFTGPRVAWLPPDEPAVVGVGETATIQASGPNRFDVIRREATTLFDSISIEASGGAPRAAIPRLLGGFAFHDEPEPGSPWTGFPGAQFVLPRVQLTSVDGQTWLALTATADEQDGADLGAAMNDAREQVEGVRETGAPPPGLTDVRRSPDRDRWREQVASAVERIDDGELEKVVLAQVLTAKLRGSFRLADTLDRLGDAYPSCYRFAVDPGLGAAFFGATPERLVHRRGDAVETDAIAGSIGRGGTAAEDERLAEVLASSPKVRHEHAVVVEAVRDRLSRVADEVDVGERSIRKLPNVQHLDTPITASLHEPSHVLELVAALHPTPAVGGLPPDAAERFIAGTERFDRGWYAAPVGWFDASGDGTFAVGIRSGVASSDRVTLFAGNGIVADSDPEEEWGELQLKYRPILDQLR